MEFRYYALLLDNNWLELLRAESDSFEEIQKAVAEFAEDIEPGYFIKIGETQ